MPAHAGLGVLAEEGDAGVAALQSHGQPAAAHHEFGFRVDGGHRERGAAVVAVPHDHLVSSAFEKAIDGGVDFAGEQLPEFRILGIGLFLAADAGDSLGVGDDEDGLAALRRGEGGR